MKLVPEMLGLRALAAQALNRSWEFCACMKAERKRALLQKYLVQRAWDHLVTEVTATAHTGQLTLSEVPDRNVSLFSNST